MAPVGQGSMKLNRTVGRSIAPTPPVAGSKPTCTSSIRRLRKKPLRRRGCLMRAVICARVSTPRQARDRNTRRQVKGLGHYAEQEGWALDGERVFLHEVYAAARA
jgi:hypothetical protein